MIELPPPEEYAGCVHGDCDAMSEFLTIDKLFFYNSKVGLAVYPNGSTIFFKDKNMHFTKTIMIAFKCGKCNRLSTFRVSMDAKELSIQQSIEDFFYDSDIYK